MTDLENRIRRLFDSAAPVTLDEIRHRQAGRARRLAPANYRRLVVAAGAAVAVIVAVGVSVAATRHPATSTTVAVGNQAAGPGAALTCDPADLSLGVGSYRQAGGQFEQTLTFTNHGRAACQLAGWPAVAAYSDGHRLQVGNRFVRQNLPPEPAARSVTLHPGSAASFDFAGGDYNNVTNRPCPTASSVAVTAPGTTKSLPVRVRFPDCGAIDITPVVAGSNNPEGPGETVRTTTPATKVSQPAAVAHGGILPGAPLDTPLAPLVTASRTGTATVDLGPRPGGANDVSISLSCLSPGTFSFPGGTFTCSTAEMHQAAKYRRTWITVPMTPGQRTVTIRTTARAAWILHVGYVHRIITAWAVNDHGETYGVANDRGTPDLVAVDNGNTQGYVNASQMKCASGDDVANPTQAAAWDQASVRRNISIPIYKNNGTTVIGTFIIGPGPAASTVPLASSHLACASPPAP
jgi:hypothetical protein